MRLRMACLLWMASLSLSACGPSGGSSSMGLHDGGKPGDALAPEDDPLRCSGDIVAVADEGREHVPTGVRVTYHHNPPASGSHWPSPHPWGVFLDQVIPPEQFVHNLEHGGIVLLTHCAAPPADGAVDPDAGVFDAQCAELERVFRALYDSQPRDKYGEVRMLLTRDPLLPTRAAAVAWDYAWTFDEPDEDALRCFRDARYGKGPEDAP